MMKENATIEDRFFAVQKAFEVPSSSVSVAGRSMDTVPVARPLLPNFEAISPYIAAIDTNRYYSNFGPLVRKLEHRLSERLSERGERDCGVLTVANGTLGLVAALQAQDPPAGRYCLLPSWTFAASAHAVLMAGLVPYFVDVEPGSGALTTEIAADAFRRLRHEVGAVMPIAPYGAPLDVDAWDAFQRDTGLAVVIDAAAGFDTARPGRVPAVVSLHATKVLPSGEGGFVTATDGDFLRRVQRVSNFGFDGTRIPTTAATNAKMSEYHAAVAMAALDGWNESRARFLAVGAGYRELLGGREDIVLPEGTGDTWASSTMVVRLPEVARDTAMANLDTASIGHRRWWGDGCHTTPAFRFYPRDPLPITRRLAASTLGLPCYQDMTREEITRVCKVICASLDHLSTAQPSSASQVPGAPTPTRNAR